MFSAVGIAFLQVGEDVNNVACAESAEAHRKVVKARAKVRRAARAKHELYGLEYRARLSGDRHVSA